MLVRTRQDDATVFHVSQFQSQIVSSRLLEASRCRPGRSKDVDRLGVPFKGAEQLPLRVSQSFTCVKTPAGQRSALRIKATL